MTALPIVRVTAVSKEFRREQESVHALRDIDMTVAEQEVLSIVGPSGCGKTTLLRMFAGLIQPTTGKILVRESSPARYTQENGVGFVFQKPLLFPWRTVLENVLLPTEIRGKGSQDANEARAEKLLHELGLEGFERVYPNELSGGMLQRAALARALITDPAILLLDEPFSALDETTREQIWTDFNRFWRDQGLTVVLVTHSIREAAFLSDRVLTMSRRPGHILAEIPVPFPPVRDHAITATSEFMELCEAIRGKFLSQ